MIDIGLSMNVMMRNMYIYTLEH